MSKLGSEQIHINYDAAERDITKLKNAISDLDECLKKLDLPTIISHSSELDGRFYSAMQYERGMEWKKIDEQRTKLKGIVSDIQKIINKYQTIDRELARIVAGDVGALVVDIINKN